jgi:hypothetical protein
MRYGRAHERLQRLRSRLHCFEDAVITDANFALSKNFHSSNTFDGRHAQVKTKKVRSSG